MKASDLFVRSLEHEGVKYIFGIPGEESLHFLESLRNSTIKLILTRHEQSAGFMAATIGRLTGSIGVCLSTLGPGATNFVTAAAYAQLGAMPMMMITGQKPINKSKQGMFQILDIVEMMRPLTKFTKQVINGDKIPVLVRQAVRTAQEERPGAVHIELPEDVAAEECENQPYDVFKVSRPSPDEYAIDKAVTMINQSNRPLILIGAAANRNRVCRALPKLIDKTGIYFFNTQMGKGVVDERNPLYLGTAAVSKNDYLHCAIDRADLIINIGHDIVEKPPFFMERNGTKVIHINNFSALFDEVYFPQLEIVGDIASSVELLTEKLQGNKTWEYSYFNRVKEEIENHIKEGSSRTLFPFCPRYLTSVIRNAMPSDGIIALDNGVYKIWFARNYKAHMSNTVLLDNALATMGAGLPSAMGAKLALPDRKVMAICGDGGFMMNSQELETAVRLKMNIVVAILRDNAYGMIKWKQADNGFSDFGLDYGNPDFVKYAESYGAIGHRVESFDQIGETLRQCLNTDGVHVVEIPVDYSESKRILIEEISVKSCVFD